MSRTPESTRYFQEHDVVSEITSESHCFGIFKPDAYTRNLVDEIERAIGSLGIQLTMRRSVELTPEDVMVVWSEITTPHVSRTIPYMTSAPVEIFATEGDDVSEQMRGLKYDIRSRYPSDNPVVSIMHTTDHDEELLRCMDHFFNSPRDTA